MSRKEHNDKEHHPSEAERKKSDQNYPYEGIAQPGWYAMPKVEEEDEIDLLELAQQLWQDRMLIAKIAGVFVILGLFVALFSSVEYKVDALLLPEMPSTQSRTSNLLQQYGGLLGVGGSGAMREQNAIPPQLFPEIIESIPYQLELMNTKVYFGNYDTTTTVQEYFREIHQPTLLGYITAYTIGLPGKIIGLFKDKEPLGNDFLADTTQQDSIYNLSKGQLETIRQLRDRIMVQYDTETGVLTFTAEMPAARATAEVAEAGIRLLKEYVREYKTQNAKEDLEFISSQAEEAGNEFEKVQQKLAEFRDSNINLTSNRAQTREQELQSEYDLAFNAYNSLRQQMVQAKLRLQEDTPVFSVLQPVITPLDNSKPNRKLIVLIFLFLGICAAVLWSLTRSWGSDFFQQIKDNNYET